MTKALNQQKWVGLILPIALLLVVAILLIFRDVRLQFSINTLHLKQWYKTVLSFVSILPMLLLVFSNYWKTQQWHRKVLLLGLVLLLISTLYSERYMINFSYVFWAAVILFALVERKMYKPNVLFALFAAYLLWHIVSYFWTIDKENYKLLLPKYSYFATIPFAFCFFQLKKEELNLLLMVLFRAALIFMFFSLGCWILESRFFSLPLSDFFVSSKRILDIGYASYDVVFAWVTFRQPTYISFIYLLLLGVGFYFRIKKSLFRPHIFEFVVFALLSFVLIWITQSRVGFACYFLLILVAVLWLLRKNKKMLIVSGIVIFAVLLLFVGIYHSKIKSVFSLDTRSQMYVTAIYSIKQHPVLGCGLGGMPQILHSPEVATQLGFDQPIENRNRHPHNQFLGAMMQTGIVGLLLLLAMLVYLLVDAIKTQKWLLLYFILLFLPVFLIETPLNRLKGIMLFAVFVSLLATNYKKEV